MKFNKKDFEEFKTIEEWKKIEDAWKAKHPILYKLREIYYWFYRLWKYKIAYFPKEIKWFIQRGRRGYSDCDLWGFDGYLAEIISKGCKQLEKEKHGYPPDLTDEEWSIILTRISEQFAEYIKIIDHDEGYEKPLTKEEFNKKLDDMFNLFRKYFTNLWD